MKEVDFRIHWMTITIWGTEGFALNFWEEWFQPFLGPLQERKVGGRGFRKRYEGLLASKIYVQPSNIDSTNVENHYFSIELPGSACDAIPDKDFQIFMLVLERYEKYRVTRLDLAWDHLPVEPEDLLNAVNEDRVRTKTSKESLVLTFSPYKKKDNGEISTSTVTFGSRQSERRIQLYNKRGYTRLELEAKGGRADAIAKDVLVDQPEDWYPKAAGHLKDFIDIFSDQEKQILASWWAKLLKGQKRANKKVSNAREVEMSRILSWFDKQVSQSLSVVADVLGEDSIQAFIVDGRRKRGPKYQGLIDARVSKDEKGERE